MRSRNRIPVGSGSGIRIPLFTKDAPAFVERDQPLKLKLPLGLGDPGVVSVFTKLPESLKPTRAFAPHHATLSSLWVFPASREMKSSGSLGLLTGTAVAIRLSIVVSSRASIVLFTGTVGLRLPSVVSSCASILPMLKKFAPPFD